jgi:ribose transport system permease protein
MAETTSSAVRAPAVGGDRRRDAARAARRLLSFNELGVAVALLVLIFGISVFHSDFLTSRVLLSVLRDAAFVAIPAYGMVFLMAMMEFDFSVGGIYGLTWITCAVITADHGVNPWLGALLVVLLGMFLGLVNGVLANAFGLPVFIIAFGTVSIFQGLIDIVSKDQPVSGLPVNSSFYTELGGDWLGIPAVAWIVVALGIGLAVVFHKTRFGAMVRAMGSNPEAAVFSGIPTQRIRIYALMLLGGLAGVSAALGLAYYQGADQNVGGSAFTLKVIVAAVIGGTAVRGGTGTVIGALLGAMIVSVINTGLIFFSVPTTYPQLVTGVVIVVAVGFDALVRRRRLLRALRGA